MQENNLIKSITINSCPHCKEQIFIETVMTPPMITSIFEKKDVEEAKKDCLERIGTLAIDEEKKEAVIKWVNNPEIIFGPTEVENIVLSLLEPEKE